MHIGIVKISFFHQITILWKALMIIYVIIAHTNIYLTYEKEMYFENENIRLFADSDGFYLYIRQKISKGNTPASF